MAETASAPPTGGNRKQSRRYAVQAVYQYLLADTDIAELARQFAGQDGYKRSDRAYLQRLMRGAVNEHLVLDELISPLLDRPIEQLDPVEHAVLLVAGFELQDCLETPYKVVINEAVELAKTFGSVEGFRYVNGVLDKLAGELRATEIGAA